MYYNSATQLFSFLFNQLTKNHIIMHHQKLFWWSSAISVILWKLKIWVFIRGIHILSQIPAFCVPPCLPKLFFFTLGQRTTLRGGWLEGMPLCLVKGERKSGVIPENQPKAWATKALSERTQKLKHCGQLSDCPIR